MPEELPGLLRGGVSWGLGTLFAGQGEENGPSGGAPRHLVFHPRNICLKKSSWSFAWRRRLGFGDDAR